MSVRLAFSLSASLTHTQPSLMRAVAMETKDASLLLRRGARQATQQGE